MRDGDANQRDDSDQKRQSALIDAWVSSGDEVRETLARIYLLGGRAYPIRLDYFKYKEKRGMVALEWKPPHGVWGVLQAPFLSPAPAGHVAIVSTTMPADDRSEGYERGTGVSLGWHEATTKAAVAMGTEVQGRLRAPDIGLVINSNDPYSVAVGEHYIRRRRLQPQQVLRVALPTTAALQPAEFEQLRSQISQHFGPTTQALALAWKAPYAVACNSITGALALGFDAELCNNSCNASRLSPYFNAATVRPYTDLGWRPSMLLAANSVAQARELIDRGARADTTLARRNRAPVTVQLLLTDDAARRVRTALYPPEGAVPGAGVQIRVAPAATLAFAKRVLMVTTGAVAVDFTTRPDWVPGGLGDHLTSVGGALDGGHGQGTALAWIASGATASHGTVSEPCNHLQKFPHPQLLLLHYLQGATALEAYWKSVAWPQQSLFIGEPLAAPFAVPFVLSTRPLLGAPTPARQPARPSPSP